MRSVSLDLSLLFRLWESLGFIFAYILQTQVCIFTKLFVLVGVLGIGMAGYLAIEFAEWKKRPRD